jgi:membrane-associated protein
VFHLDTQLSALVAAKGAWAYGLLSFVVFAETGLVITPILPGDSLLFAAGALTSIGSLDIRLLLLCLLASAIAGDSVNYSLGRALGSAAFFRFPSVFKPEYLQRTRSFYSKYGGKTIVLARFVPIVRTFAPFIAGVGSMNRTRFAFYNVFGAFLWTCTFTLAGFFFGGLPVVQKNFSAVIFAIVGISLIPVIVEVIQQRRSTSSSEGSPNASSAADEQAAFAPANANSSSAAVSMPPPQSAVQKERVQDRRAWIDQWKERRK